ncbi:MAG: ferritin-like domain-containing protein [Candidatus Eremiobacteraeota bacterium]|nr:ferritin-like domain-containing protein [Candidatus Eremiobacteraeota bacterium]
MKISRARFVVASALGASAALLVDGLTAAAAGADPRDLSTLNAAIELERAAIKAYDDAEGTKLLSPPVLRFAALFKGDHQAHLAALMAAVSAGGGVPSLATAKLEYPQLAREKDVIAFARSIEEKAAATYLSVLPDLRDRALAQAAASILGVETMHVGILADALGSFSPYPTGFVQ